MVQVRFALQWVFPSVESNGWIGDDFLISFHHRHILDHVSIIIFLSLYLLLYVSTWFVLCLIGKKRQTFLHAHTSCVTSESSGIGLVGFVRFVHRNCPTFWQVQYFTRDPRRLAEGCAESQDVILGRLGSVGVGWWCHLSSECNFDLCQLAIFHYQVVAHAGPQATHEIRVWDIRGKNQAHYYGIIKGQCWLL